VRHACAAESARAHDRKFATSNPLDKVGVNGEAARRVNLEDQSLQCPYCGEAVDVSVEGVGAADESYVEDCPVCCRPWTVHVHRDEDRVDVQLAREDA
jgi:hypothetical protein